MFKKYFLIKKILTILSFGSGATASFALTIGIIFKRRRLSIVACRFRLRWGSAMSGLVSNT